MVLKALTSLYGVSGDEDDVRDFLMQEAEKLADEVTVDALGSLIAYKKGTGKGNRVMLAAHMDEVGFIVKGYNDNGSLKFSAVGGVDTGILPGKQVLTGKKRLPGVIASKPVHLLEKEEAEKVTEIKRLYIDIGANSKEEAEKLVLPGEYIYFAGEYMELGSCIKARALDDRAGCAILLDALKDRYSFDLYCCFTVQEEVGLRGAEAVAYRIVPDIAFVIEGTTCSDVPGVMEYDYSSRMGEGPVLTIIDRRSYSDPELIKFIHSTATAENIPVQYKKGATGGNDAGKIQTSRMGVRVASISVPCRYIHSPVSMMSKDDFENCKRLVNKVLQLLGSDGAILLENS